jgi:myosin heavy subunit
MNTVKKNSSYTSRQIGTAYFENTNESSLKEPDNFHSLSGSEDLTLLLSNKALRKENTYLKEECKYLRKRLENLENAVKEGNISQSKSLKKHGSFTNARLELEKKSCHQEIIQANEKLEKENYDLKAELKRVKNSAEQSNKFKGNQEFTTFDKQESMKSGIGNVQTDPDTILIKVVQ